MDKKEPKFKIGQRVLLDAEVYKKGDGNIPVGAFEILEIYCGGNEYSYFLKPEMTQPEGVMPSYVYDEKWLISLSENNVGKGIEKQIKNVELLFSPEEARMISPNPNLCKLSDALACLVEKEKNATVSYGTEKDNRKLTVNILGTDYRIVEKPLEGCDGYCDSTTKEIAVTTKKDSHDMGDFENYRKKTFRHEVIHAYHYESGLAENLENKQYGFSETLVDWFAYQSPKIFKTFEELGIL